jgi:hypothetical protein
MSMLMPERERIASRSVSYRGSSCSRMAACQKLKSPARHVEVARVLTKALERHRREARVRPSRPQVPAVQHGEA